MTKRSPDNDGLNDADIAALFANDNTQPPTELDRLVLANAHASGNKIEDNEPFLNRYSPLLATAAVLMIAFALTPLTLQEPKPSMENADVAASISLSNDSDADNSEADNSEAMRVSKSVASPQAEQESGNANDQITEPVATNNVSDATSSTEILGQSERLTPQASVAQSIESSQTDAVSDEALAESATAAESVAESASEIEKPVEIASDSVSIDSAAVPAAPNAQASSNESLARIATESRQATSASASDQTSNALASNTSEQTGVNALRARSQANQAQGVSQNEQSQKNEPAYRNSPLLWVLEIKRLYTENDTDSAKKELTDFREKHPDSTHERLLPVQLLSEIEE